MANLSSPNLPKSRIPAWERRRKADHWKWNGSRRGDPGLPHLDSSRRINPLGVLAVAAVASLAGIALLFLALR